MRRKENKFPKCSFNEVLVLQLPGEQWSTVFLKLVPTSTSSRCLWEVRVARECSVLYTTPLSFCWSNCRAQQTANTTAFASTAVKTQRRSFPSTQAAALALKSTHGAETLIGHCSYLIKTTGFLGLPLFTHLDSETNLCLLAEIGKQPLICSTSWRRSTENSQILLGLLKKRRTNSLWNLPGQTEKPLPFLRNLIFKFFLSHLCQYYLSVPWRNRRATSSELPMAMRFRHLEKISKEAVGVYR